MPELPDVQVFKQYVDATSLHQRVDHVYLSADGLLADVSGTTLRRHLEGEELDSTRRHGKQLFIDAGEGGWLRWHFGMTGKPSYWKGDGPDGSDPGHTRLRLDFRGSGHLAYVNVRKLGGIGLVDDPDAWIREAGLGPDALDPELDEEALGRILEGRSAAIKSTLMDQHHLAGIGNVYADEILFQAGIHPETPAGDLDEGDVKELLRQTRRVLKAAVDARVEDFPGWFLLPHRVGDHRCPKCGDELEQTRVSGRTTWFCPRRQGTEP